MTEAAAEANQNFDVIVVGAGPAGLAAATVCARAGLDTIVIERGRKPGVKNVMGGVLYTRPTAEVFGEFWKDAPLERCVIEQNVWILTEDSVIKVGYRSPRFAEGVPNAFTVLRAKVDEYFAQQTQAAGALLINETKVDEVLRDEQGQVTGVRTGRPDGEVYAPLVIIAEGVNPELTRQLGMQSELRLEDAASTVKEVIRLDREVIEDRFNLRPGEGATIEMYGAATKGMLGTAFLYTNQTSLSLGVGVLLADAIKGHLTPFDMLQELKEHPAVAPLIEGGETGEYSSHLIPEGGYNRLPALFSNGVLVVGDAAQLVNGLHREGSNHAILSGKVAAETAVEAHEKGDFSARTLHKYRERLTKDVPTLTDLRTYRNASAFMERHPWLLSLYPQMAADSIAEMMTVDGEGKRSKQWKIFWDVLRRGSIPRMVWDAIDGGRSFI